MLPSTYRHIQHRNKMMQMRTVTLLAHLFLVLSVTGAPTALNLKSLTRMTTERPRVKSFSQLIRRKRRRKLAEELGCFEPPQTIFRTLTGVCNNQKFPRRGAADQPFLTSEESIRRNEFPGPLPNPRLISNIVHDEPEFIPNDRNMSELLVYFGQFLDHVVTEFHNDENAPVEVVIPPGDPFFTPGQIIRFFRSIKVRGGPENILSSYVDASAVYGVDANFSKSLRKLADGEMKVRGEPPNELLPVDENGFHLQGDIRGDENPILAAMHLIWVREHNRVARELVEKVPNLTDDEEIFQLARHIVAAELQAVVWHEFIPALTGSKLPDYTGYKKNVRARVTNAFTTAAFRVGHTLLPKDLALVNKTGDVFRRIKLRNTFFRPGLVDRNRLVAGQLEKVNFLDAFIRGVLIEKTAEVDAFITGELRNHLTFNRSDEDTILDLVTLNIARGRDHALPSCNNLRASLGLEKFTRFRDVSSDDRVRRRLRRAYANVDDIDPWTCGIAEDHVPGSSLGSLFQKIVRQQFTDLRDGDRFYFEQDDYFPVKIKEVPTVKRLRNRVAAGNSVFRIIIAQNTGLKRDEIQREPFFVPPPVA